MSKSKIFALLASAGVLYAGPVTTDAGAFAAALETGTDEALVDFVTDNPKSPFALDAIILAANQKGKGTSASTGSPKGPGHSSGNPGDGPSGNISEGVGNAGGSF